MKSGQSHIQCKLRKKYKHLDGPSIVEAFQVSWLPEKYAVLGKYVRLRTEDEENPWEDGWEVIELGNKLPTKYVLERSGDFRKQRKASDI